MVTNTMAANNEKYGFSLTEMLVVIAVMAILFGIGVPAAKQLVKSYDSPSNVMSLIKMAIAKAQSIAARTGDDAGIRFQTDSKGDQYMIYIVHDHSATGLVSGFRAVSGVDPIKLPSEVGLMDLRIRTNHGTTLQAAEDPDDEPIYDGDAAASNGNIDGDYELKDTTAFSMVFLSTGKLTMRDVRVRNKDGKTDDTSNDEIFNTDTNVDGGSAQFYQDDYADLGLGQESSRNSFIIYETGKLDIGGMGSRWTSHLQYLDVTYINPYTGEIID